MASRQTEHSAKCSCSRLRSSALSWPEVATAQSSRNSSWGSCCANAPAPLLEGTFYHTANVLAICSDKHVVESFLNHGSSGCVRFPKFVQVLPQSLRMC